MGAQHARHLRLERPPPVAPTWRLWKGVTALSRSRTAGHALLVISAAAFFALALLALFGESVLLRLDQPIHREVLDARSGWLDRVMTWISLLGNRYVIGAILMGLTGWALATRRCRRTVLVLLGAFAANLALEAVLKSSIGRPRPDLLQLVPGNGPSFPSGHVLATVGFYGTLAVVAWRSTARAWSRSVAFLVATAVILCVGFSRIYLGVHWFSDVLGGLAVGTIFVLLVTRGLGDHHLARRRTCCRAHLSVVS